MTSLRNFHMLDLFKFNGVNLDPLTETYGLNFYMHYMSKWPEYFQIATAPSGKVTGYLIGKAEGQGKLWHGHVSAVTVAPKYRNLGLATKLMNICENVTNERHNAWFIDLFVRAGNKVAITMYDKLGYTIYRTVMRYYSDNGEDGLDLRKPMKRDKEKVSLICKKKKIKPRELEWD